MPILDDRVVVKVYREYAQGLRAKAVESPDQKAREATLRLADEYEWRASSLEAAMAMHRDPQTFP